MRFAVLAGAIVLLGAAACSDVVVDPDNGLGSAAEGEVEQAEGATTDTLVSTSQPTTTAQPTTTTSTAPTTRAPRRPVVVGIAGDSTFTNGLETRDPFGQIVDLLEAPDFMVINLETAVADADVGRPPVAKSFLFKSPPVALDLLVEAGIDGVTLGNNHALDYGPAALEQTLDELDARDILRVGAGRDEAEAFEPLIVTIGEWTVGLVSFSRVPCDWSASGENTRPQIGWACPPFQDKADATVLSAIEQSDVTIVMMHGGEEGVLCPSPFMVELTQHFADLGADVVINGHPHVLQGLGQHGDTLVAYSTGNFAFPPARGISGNSAIIEIGVAEDGLTMRVVPVRSEGGVLRPPSDTEAAAILEQVNRHSSGVRVDDSGLAAADPAVVGECGQLS